MVDRDLRIRLTISDDALLSQARSAQTKLSAIFNKPIEIKIDLDSQLNGLAERIRKSIGTVDIPTRLQQPQGGSRAIPSMAGGGDGGREIQQQTVAIAALSASLQKSFGDTQKFAESLGLTGREAQSAAQRIGQLTAAGATTAEKYRALSGEFGLSARQISLLSNTSKELEARLRATAQAAAEAARAAGNSGSEVSGLARAFGVTFREAQQLATGLGLTAKESREAVNRLRDLKGAGATAGDAFDVLQRELGITEDQFKKLATAAARSSGEIRQSVGPLGNILQGVGQGFGQAALGALQDGLRGIVGIIGGAINQFGALDKALTDFSIKANVSKDALGPLREEIGEIAIITSQTPQGVAETAAQMVALGRSAEQVQKELRPVTVLADILGEDPVLTGQVISVGASQFEALGETAESLADKILFLNNTTAAGSEGGISEFKDLLSQAGGAAGALDVSFDELGAAFATIRKAGIDSSTAGLALKNTFISLAAPTTRASGALKKLGVDAFDAQGNFVGLTPFLQDFSGALEGLSQQEQLSLVEKIFGREAAPAIIAQLNEVEASYASAIEGLATSAAGSGERALEELNKTIPRQLEILQGSLETLGVQAGAALGPAFQSILENANEIVGTLLESNVFDDLAVSAQEFADSLNNNPELIEKLTENAKAALDLIDQLGASVLVTLQNLSESDNALEGIQSITETINGIILALKIVTEVSKLFFDGIINGVSTITGPLGFLINSGAFSAIADGARAFGEALDGVIQKINAIAQTLGNVPIIGRLLEARDAAEATGNAIANIGQGGEGTALGGAIASGSTALRERLQVASDELGGGAADPGVEAEEESAEDRLAVLQRESTERRAILLASGASEEEIRAQQFSDEQENLNARIGLNQEKLAELRNLLSTQSGEDAAKTRSEILQVEQTIADDRLKIQENLASDRERIEREALEKIEQANQEAERAIAISQSERTAAIRQQQLSGAISAEDATRQIEQIQIDGSRRAIALKRDEIAQIEGLRADGVLSEEDALNQIGQLQQEIAADNLRLIEQEIEARKRAALAAIDAQFAPQQRQQQQSLDQTDLASSGVAAQQGLLTARTNLQQALADLSNQQLQSDIAAAESAGNVEGATRRRLELLDQQTAQLEAQQEAERQSLALSQQQRAIDLDRQRIQSEIAQTEAEIALAKAQAEGASADEIANLQRILDLRGQQVGIAAGAIAQNQQVNQLEQQTLSAQQATARESNIQSQIQDLSGLSETEGLTTRTTNRINRRIERLRDSGYEGGLNGSEIVGPNQRPISLNSFANNIAPTAIDPNKATMGAVQPIAINQPQRAIAPLSFPVAGAAMIGGDGISAVVTVLQGIRGDIASAISAMSAERAIAPPSTINVSTPDPVRDLGQVLDAVARQNAKGARL